jgi:hypothetical protein
MNGEDKQSKENVMNKGGPAKHKISTYICWVKNKGITMCVHTDNTLPNLQMQEKNTSLII